MAESVDPVTHLVIPLLALLAAKQNVRMAVLLSVFAILPDFDSLFGPHRMVLHNVFVIVLIPLAFIAFARLRKPNLVLPGLIVLFYLCSHTLLDLDGVAFFYPLDANAYKFIPVFEFFTAPTVHFAFYFDWGVVPLLPATEYRLISGLTIAYILFVGLLGFTYRDGVKKCIRKTAAAMKLFLRRILRYGGKKGSP
jgi:hypothetical protein